MAAVADVRAFWRARHPPPTLGRRLDVAYTTVVVGAIVGVVAYGTARNGLAQAVTPDGLARYGPSVALVALLFTALWGAYHGPVVFTVADVRHLLGAPLARRGLAWRLLARSLGIGAAAGAVAAAALVVGLAGDGRTLAVARAGGLLTGLALLGLLGVAAAWAVERSARLERIAWRILWPVVALAGALALAPSGVALWSGPWGWALQPATGGHWGVGLALLALTAGGAGALALRSGGACPTERHERRAEARASAVASLSSYDLRTARRTLERVGAPRRSRRAWAGGRLIRHAVLWRDLVAAGRAPARVVQAIALAAAGTALAVRETDRPVAVLAAVALVYCGAARLLWPLRSELDLPDRMGVLLVRRRGRILLAHTAVPALILTIAAMVAAAACAATATATGALAAITVAPLATACAAMSARREGRLPPSVLVSAAAADPSGGLAALLMWLVFWPALGVAVGTCAMLAGAAGPVLALLAAAALARAVARDPVSG